MGKGGGKDTDFPAFKVGGSGICNCDGVIFQEGSLAKLVFCRGPFLTALFLPPLYNAASGHLQQSLRFQVHHFIPSVKPIKAPYVFNPPVRVN